MRYNLDVRGIRRVLATELVLHFLQQLFLNAPPTKQYAVVFAWSAAEEKQTHGIGNNTDVVGLAPVNRVNITKKHNIK